MCLKRFLTCNTKKATNKAHKEKNKAKEKGICVALVSIVAHSFYHQ